jgi:hypothetical protein
MPWPTTPQIEFLSYGFRAVTQYFVRRILPAKGHFARQQLQSLHDFRFVSTHRRRQTRPCTLYDAYSAERFPEASSTKVPVHSIRTSFNGLPWPCSRNGRKIASGARNIWDGHGNRGTVRQTQDSIPAPAEPLGGRKPSATSTRVNSSNISAIKARLRRSTGLAEDTRVVSCHFHLPFGRRLCRR